MPNTGEKPGKGEYTCVKCGQVVKLNDEEDKLPPCPNCGCTHFF